MKVKHFSGYGSVNVKLVECKLNVMANIETFKIKVVGNHEQGLKRIDNYDVWHWLITRVVKKYKKTEYIPGKIKGIEFEYLPDEDDVECGMYTITTNWE